MLRDVDDTWTVDDSYQTRDPVDIAAVYNMPVDVNGEAGISFRIGNDLGKWRAAMCNRGISTNVIVFRHLVKSFGSDGDGIRFDGWGKERNNRQGAPSPPQPPTAWPYAGTAS